MVKSLEFKISLISLVIVHCTAPQPPNPAQPLPLLQEPGRETTWKGMRSTLPAPRAPQDEAALLLSTLRDSLASGKLETELPHSRLSVKDLR